MPPGRTASCLIGGNTITKDFIIAHRILPLTAAITGISLDGIDNAVFAFFHDTHMVGLSVLGPEEPFWESQSKKIIMPGVGSMLLSAHCPRSLNHWTPFTQPANLGMMPFSI